MERAGRCGAALGGGRGGMGSVSRYPERDRRGVVLQCSSHAVAHCHARSAIYPTLGAPRRRERIPVRPAGQHETVM